MHIQQYVTRAALLTLVPILSVFSACEHKAHHGNDAAAADSNESAVGPALRLMIGPPGEQELVLVGPSDARANVDEGVATPGPSARSSKRGPSRDITGSIGRATTVYGTNWRGAYDLIKAAARSCDPTTHSVQGDHGLQISTPWYVLTDVLWQAYPTKWYVFDRTQIDSSCDNQLVAKQVLLCAADRIAQMSDSVGTHSWEYADDSGAVLKVTVPPQAVEDRFVAREIASSILAHLARMDMESWANGWGRHHCIEAYAAYANADAGDELPASVVSQWGFDAELPPRGVTYRESPEEYSLDELRALGRGRLEVATRTSVAASRMLRDMVEMAVRDDLAGSEKLAAQAGDPGEAARIRWGYDGDENPAQYNSLGHALRVLFGRLETGGPSAGDVTGAINPAAWSAMDPQCGGFAAGDLIHALPSGETARWTRRTAATPGQSLALSILNPAGLLVPKSRLSSPHLRAGVVNQLMIGLGMTPESTPTWSGGKPVDTAALPARAQALLRVLDGVSDADLRFALQDNESAMSLIIGRTNAADVMFPTPAQGVLFGVRVVPEEEKSWYFQALRGAAVKGGVPSGDLAADPTSRVLTAAAKSQCSLWKTTAFQDPFALAREFKAQLVKIQEAAEDDVPRGVDVAIAEVGEWAGDLFVETINYGSFSETGICTDVGRIDNALGRFLNAAASDVGQSPGDYLAVVYTSPRRADCLAGIRSAACSDGPPPEIDGVWTTYGDSCVVFRHQASTGHYVVARGGASRQGKILAYIREVPGLAAHTQFVSPYQRELAGALFGLGTPERRSRTCGEPWDTTVPPTSCVLGLPREQFIPLANELTSSGGVGEDSWKHYLSNAREAAAEADALGTEWIDRGLQRELRREGAQEELANLCGSFVDASQVTATDGVLDPAESEGGLNACLDAEVYDVVFITNPVFNGKSNVLGDSDFKQATWHAYCDNVTVGRPGFCELSGSQTAESRASALQMASLDLAPAVMENPGEGCAEIEETAAAMAVGGHPNLNVLSDVGRQTTPARMSAALLGYQFSVYREDQIDGLHSQGDWELLRNGVVALAGHMSEHTPCANLNGDQELCTQLLALFGDRPNLYLRVQRVLWYMGAMAGEVPALTFAIPVPVANMGPSGGARVASAYPVAIYGESVVSSESTGTRLGASGVVNDLSDVAVIGDLVPAAPAVYELYPAGLPGSWQEGLRQDMAAEEGYYLALAANEDIPFDEAIVDADGNLGTREALGEWIASVARNLSDPAAVARATHALNGYGILGRDVCVTNGAAVLLWNEGELEVNDFLTQCKAVCDQSGAKTLEDWLGLFPYRTATYNYNSTENHLATWDSNCMRGPGTLRIASECLELLQPADGSLSEVLATGERLRPTSCSPGERVQLFVNSDAADFGATLATALALGCRDSGGGGASAAPPPQINSTRDIRQLEGWLQHVEEVGVEALGAMALTEVPKAVVDDYREGAVGTGTGGTGERGGLMLELRTNMEGMHQAWTSYVGSLAQVRAAIATARVQIEAVDENTASALLGLQRERFELDRQVAVSSVQESVATSNLVVIGGLALGYQHLSEGVGAANIAQLNGQYARQLLENVSLSSAVVAEQGETQQSLLVLDLNSEASEGYTGLDTSMSMFRTSLAEAKAALIDLDQNADRAGWQAAKAAGADFVEIDGEPVQLPVNTVLNRQYDILKERYTRSLDRAKRSAYVARLAIEQRLGVRLGELHTDVGPLPPPSTWADDLCTMQGVDYEALKAAQPPATTAGTGGTSGTGGSGTTGEDLDLIAGFADEYIGEYVDKLAEFMEFYNIEYPFKESDDTAVLSVRNDLIHPVHECVGASANLLYHSDDLTQTGFVEEGSSSLEGWRSAPCKDEVCVRVHPGAAVTVAGEVASPPSGRGGVSWVESREPGSGPGEPADLPPEAPPAADPALPGALYQSVALAAGTDYVLSWWDLALSAEGESLLADDAEADTTYEVGVYDAAWALVAYDSPIAVRGEAWSPRRALAFTAPASGDYHIAFFASPVGTSGGNVALANVQLEVSPDMGGAAGDYEPTDKNRWRVDADCTASAEWNLREAFNRVCQGGNDGGATMPACWWELKTPIVLDMELAQAGYGPLVDKVALGNYNERHTSTALNVVGTGVIDCTKDPSPDCYGNGYLEYELVHAATNVPLVGYNADEVRCFDFAIGAIRGAKALATERYITMPLGSADRDLLAQPAFTKTEFAGRPLSGTYTLRIKDVPRLAWDHVEDIQIIMNYRVWSRVAKPAGL